MSKFWKFGVESAENKPKPNHVLLFLSEKLTVNPKRPFTHENQIYSKSFSHNPKSFPQGNKILLLQNKHKQPHVLLISFFDTKKDKKWMLENARAVVFNFCVENNLMCPKWESKEVEEDKYMGLANPLCVEWLNDTYKGCIYNNCTPHIKFESHIRIVSDKLVLFFKTAMYGSTPGSKPSVFFNVSFAVNEDLPSDSYRKMLMRQNENRLWSVDLTRNPVKYIPIQSIMLRKPIEFDIINIF